jgi:hypothetical protein
MEDNPLKAQNYIASSGINKGKVAIKSVTSKGQAYIRVMLKDKPEDHAAFTTSFGEKRKADSIKFSHSYRPFKSLMPHWATEFGLKIYDQYGSEMKYEDENNFYVRLSFKHNSGNAFGTFLGSAEKDLTVNAPYGNFKYVFQTFSNGPGVAGSGQLGTVSNVVYHDFTIQSVFDKMFRFYTGDSGDSNFTFKAAVYESGTNQEINSFSTAIQTFDPKNTSNVNYSVVLLPFNYTSTIVALRDVFGDSITAESVASSDDVKFAKISICSRS